MEDLGHANLVYVGCVYAVILFQSVRQLGKEKKRKKKSFWCLGFFCRAWSWDSNESLTLGLLLPETCFNRMTYLVVFSGLTFNEMLILWSKKFGSRCLQ